MIGSSQLALSKETSGLKAMDAVISDEDVADLFPWIRKAVTDDAGKVLA